MRLRWVFVLALLFLPSFVSAQAPQDARFWLMPDEHETDKNGKLITAIEKDRQHYTARFFTRGQWIEYRYAPHTERILSITGSDTTEEYLYDAHDAYIGKNIHVDGRLLTIRMQGRDRFGAGDMPMVELTREDGDRVIAISSGSTSIAQLHSVDGHTDAVRLGNGVELSIQPRSGGGYREVLTDAGGRVLDDRMIANTAIRKPADIAQLDAIAADLGLPAAWRKAITIQANSTGSVWFVRDEHGKTLMYIAREGGYSAGFDRSGKAVYYDVAADLYVGRVANPEGWADLAALVPDHYTFTRDGRIGAYVRGPAVNAIEAIWSGRDETGRAFIRFRHSAPGGSATPQAGTASSVPGNAAGSIAAVKRPGRSLRPAPDDFCIIDYTITTYGDGTSVIDITGVTCFYFGGDGSGGGSTGGGSAYASNQTSGPLIGKVNNALTSATARLANTDCASLFSTLTNSQGVSLIDIMYQRGFADLASYISGGVSIADGQYHKDQYGNTPCNMGYCAWVATPGTPAIWVCDSFNNLSSSDAALYLIHELLHTLGLEEGGTHMSSADINTLVNQACG